MSRTGKQIIFAGEGLRGASNVALCPVRLMSAPAWLDALPEAIPGISPRLFPGPDRRAGENRPAEEADLQPDPDTGK